MRIRGILLLPAVALLSLPAARAQEERKDPEDRLLEAQLLEVSTGDLEKAKAIYQAIRGDEKVPQATRDRASLYLARAQRKLGEVEASKKLLEELVKSSADRETLRQARSFLRELQTGRPESPEFDWLKELEKSPEIQARVFDLTLDLVDLTTEAGQRARRQLIALGAVAVPVIERVIETTKDPRHRQHLALVLLHSGRFERLSMVFDPKVPPDRHQRVFIASFLQAVPTFPEEERRRLLEAVEKMPLAPETEPYREVVRLYAGDTSNLKGKLPHFERFNDRDFLEGLLHRDRAAAQVIADRILAEDCPAQLRLQYLDLLRNYAPAKLDAPHWKVAMPSLAVPSVIDPGLDKYIAELERREAFDILSGLASTAGPSNQNQIVRYFSGKYLSGSDRKPSEAPPALARVFRAAKAFEFLQLLAEANDGALPEFVDFMRNREKEGPEYSVYRLRSENWRPSPRFIDAMVGLLDSKDPVVLTIALGTLSWAPAETPEGAFSAVEKVRKETQDVEVRVAALKVVVGRFGKHPEMGPQLAGALLEEFEQALKMPSSVARRLVKFRPGPRPARMVSGPLTADLPRQMLDQLVANVGDPARLVLLYPHVLELSDSPTGALFHEWYFRQLGGGPSLLTILFRKLDFFRSLEARAALVNLISSQSIERDAYSGEDLEKLDGFLRKAATDPILPTEARLKAFLKPPEPAFDWFDWPQVLGGNDPLSGALLFEKSAYLQYQDQLKPFRKKFWTWVRDELPEDRRAAIFQAALKSPQENVRASAIEHYLLNRGDAPEVLRLALEDSSTKVSSEAVKRLQGTSRADMEPVFYGLLSHQTHSLRVFAIDSLKRFSSRESIGPLVKLLDDPDVEIRGKALSALKEISQALKEKLEWEELFRGLEAKPPQKEDP